MSRKPETQSVDAAIIGCGLAGGLLAGRLARDGFSVVALEKRPKIGVPVRCGEAAGSRDEIGQFIPIDERWIVAEINGARMYAPDGTIVEKRMPGVGVMLKRDVFDQALTDQARGWGADIRTHQEVIGLKRSDDRITGVVVKDHTQNGCEYEIDSRIVIGADGVECFSGRWAGLTQHLRPRHIHAAVEYLLEGDGFPTDTIELYLGHQWAPGGYAWVFPKGAGRANVGLGVHPSKAQDGTAREYLDRFVADRYPNARVLKLVAGGVSGSPPLKTMVGEGILLVGEAGYQNNPFSGGGIMNALEGAEEAHSVLRDALKVDDLSREYLRRYDEAWHQRNGKNIEKFAKLRELFFTFDDGDMNKVVSVMKKAVQAQTGGITDYAELFAAAFRTTPGVLWKARKILW